MGCKPTKHHVAALEWHLIQVSKNREIKEGKEKENASFPSQFRNYWRPPGRPEELEFLIFVIFWNIPKCSI